MKKTQIGAAIDEMLANTGKNTVNSPIATNQPITVSMDLLPDVKVGDTITLKVTDVVADKMKLFLVGWKSRKINQLHLRVDYG